MPADFQSLSFQKHENTYSCTDIDSEISAYANWFSKHSVDLERHLIMLSVLDPILKNLIKSTWVTIGDGRFGTSAQYINNRNGTAHATDIDLRLLKIAYELKWIPEYSYANCEKLPFKDNEFEFSFCKQAFHHFPRPALGFYEMLRVSSKGIVFVEPSDWQPRTFLRNLAMSIKRSLKGVVRMNNVHPDTGSYEPDGNYVFGISLREFERMAIAMNFSMIVYKRFDDIHFPGMENEMMSEKGILHTKWRKKLKWLKLLQIAGWRKPNQIMICVFKISPEQRILDEYEKDGFRIVHLPRNPYV